MTDRRLKVAAVQMTSSADVPANLAQASNCIADAAAQGAGLVVLPENFFFMGRSESERLAYTETDSATPGEDTPLQAFLSAEAARHGLWLVGGTIPLAGNDPGRAFSASLVYRPDGSRAVRYDKIHLFDVTLPGGKTEYRESGSTLAGEKAAVAPAPFGGLGVAVCYDLRFPELFRIMSASGATIMAVGAAFTATTGEAHWETLVRARAIENQAVVVAAAQGGHHAGGRHTWGHSMIVDAWGRILAERDQDPGVVIAEIDLSAQDALRNEFPALAHRRLAMLEE